MIAGREYILTDWNIIDFIRCRTPYYDALPKRPQECQGPSGIDSTGSVKRLKLAARYLQTESEAGVGYTGGKDDEGIREENTGKENNRGSTVENGKRQVEFRKIWVETID